MLVDRPRVKVKVLEFAPKHYLSLQRHAWRREMWIGMNVFLFRYIRLNDWHTYLNNSLRCHKVLEIQWGHACLEKDIERLSDGGLLP